MFLKKNSKKHETYQICIAILEAKHLVQNENPLVVVKVGNQKRKTAVREKTDNPHFNDVSDKTIFVIRTSENMWVLFSVLFSNFFISFAVFCV